MTGYWPLLHYVIFFLMVGSSFRTEREIARLLEFSVGISFFVALVALVQKIEPELIWRMQNGRVGSLLSNPAFLGDYLVCNGLLGVWLFSQVNRSLERQVLAAVIGVLLVAVLLSETRAALLGLYLAALAYFSVKALLEKVACRRLLFRSGLVALALVPVVVWAAGSSSLLAGVPGMGRFADVSWGSANVEARLINWGIALEGFQERPIFGWGPETYYRVFDLHYDPRIEELEFSAKGFDRPHNRLLEQLSDTGVVGGLAYLASLLLVVGHLLMAYQRARIDVDTLAASIAIGISFLVQGFFLFDHPVGLLMLSMVLAWWHVAGGRARLAGGRDGPSAAAGDARRSNGVRIAVALVVAIAVSAAHWFSFVAKPAWASNRVRHAASLAASDFSRASEIVEAVLANSQQYRPMAVEYYARMVIQYAKQSQHPDAFIQPKVDAIGIRA
jgi:O-antigen ligase